LFLENLEIKKFYGVGKVTVKKMYRFGIFTGKDLKDKSLNFLIEKFGKSGSYYYQVVRGTHNSKVSSSRTRKSLAAERTFHKNITAEIFMMERLVDIASEVERRLTKSKVAGKTVTLKIKYSDFTLQTRSKTLAYYISKKEIILETVKDLLFQESMKESVRLLGISISNLNNTKGEAPKEKEVIVQLKFDF
jgi:DNA polymerase-4